MKKKLLTMLLASAMILGCLAGCGKTETKQSEETRQSEESKQPEESQQQTSVAEQSQEEVILEIGDWPTDTNPADKALYEDYKKRFEEMYPYIKVVPNEWKFDVKTFLPTAASGLLPTLYKTYFTEVDRIVDAGYAADMTDVFQKYGYIDALTDNIKELITRDGKYYFTPSHGTIMGLAINKNLFEQAGLVNADGTLQIPQTYDELIETSKIIKEKTGAYGFGMATTGAGGGWRFINIAWSFGTKFMENVDGKWVSTFGTQECADALKYYQDLKWKHQIIPDNVILSGGEVYEMFATDKLAMTFTEHTGASFVTTYGMDRSELAYGALPAGPADRCTQLTGVLYCVSNTATEAQKDAAVKWLNFIGVGPELTQENRDSIVGKYAQQSGAGKPVGIFPYPIWNESNEVRQFTESTVTKYANIDMKYFKEYANFGALTVLPEEPAACQDLYQVLSNCMQEVLTDENADPLAIVQKASEEFQKNSLDLVE